MKKVFLAAAILASAFTTNAFADNHESGHYAGFRVGAAHSGMSNSDLGSTSLDKTDWAAGAYFGHRYNKYLAAEIGWDYLGEYDFKAGGAHGDVELDVLSASVLGIYPVTDKFEVFGKVGGGVTFSKTSVSGLGSSEDRDFGLLAGAGATYHFDKQVALRAEWTHYDDVGLDSDGDMTEDVDAITLGAVWKF